MQEVCVSVLPQLLTCLLSLARWVGLCLLHDVAGSALL